MRAKIIEAQILIGFIEDEEEEKKRKRMSTAQQYELIGKLIAQSFLGSSCQTVRRKKGSRGSVKTTLQLRIERSSSRTVQEI